MKWKILNLFFLLNILDLINSDIDIQGKIKYEMGNMNYSIEKDLGQCQCDLSKFCDYNCPCDTYDNGKKCDESYENIDRMEEYKCKSRRESFEYNKKNATIKLKDHIHSLMCVQFDRTKDLGEFYKKEPLEADTLAKEWVSQFFPIISDKKSDMIIYKPDSNGYCVNSIMKEVNNNEYSCILKAGDETDLKNNLNDDNKKYGNTNNKVNEIIMNKKDVAEILYMDENSKIVNFKNLWRNGETGNNAIGYIQGTPLKIILEGTTTYKQFYFPIIDSQGKCIIGSDTDNAINFKPFLFKNDAIFACGISGGDITTSYIYQNLCVNQMKICTNPKCDNSLSIECFDYKNNENVKANIQLNIYTSKKGKEYSPYEEIIGVKAFKKTDLINNGLILKINFIDVSYSAKMNTKDGKITSLIPLSENILNALDEIDD